MSLILCEFYIFLTACQLFLSRPHSGLLTLKCRPFTRKQNKLNKYIETQKQKFTQLELQDIEMREKIRHSKNKNKKLQKQLEKDKQKVCRPFKN